jgi:hypothetical protein
MPIRARLLCLSLLAALAGSASAGTAQVNFVDPDSYADIGTHGSDADANMQTIRRHLEALAANGLPADETLKIDVLDVDLAGTVRPSTAAFNAVRVVTGQGDYPSIRLRWVLSGPGIARSGDEQLADTTYTSGLTQRVESGPLYYDKRMLTSWFQSRFGAADGH